MFKKILGIVLIVALLTMALIVYSARTRAPTLTEPQKGAITITTLVENALKNKYKDGDEVVVRGTVAEIYPYMGGFGFEIEIEFGSSHKGYIVRVHFYNPGYYGFVDEMKEKLRDIQIKREEIVIKGRFAVYGVRGNPGQPDQQKTVLIKNSKLIETP